MDSSSKSKSLSTTFPSESSSMTSTSNQKQDYTHERTSSLSSSKSQRLKDLFKPLSSKGLGGSEGEYDKARTKEEKRAQRKADYDRLGLDGRVKGVGTGNEVGMKMVG